MRSRTAPTSRRLGSCIYCPRPADGDEHWIPSALGRFESYAPLVDRLCSGCNQRLGALVDEELLRTGLVGFARAAMGLRGDVNPFHYRAMRSTAPSTLMMPASHGRWSVLAEVISDRRGVQGNATPLRQLVFLTRHGQIECVQFPPGYSVAMTKRLLRERGVEYAELKEVYLDLDEPLNQTTLSAFLSAVLGRPFETTVYGGGRQPGGEEQQLPGHFEVTAAYFRGLAKIGFHYFLYAFPHIRGNELAFSGIRQFIFEGIGDPEQFVELLAHDFVSDICGDFPDARVSHYLFASMTAAGGAIAGVQFFRLPRFTLPASVVSLGRTPTRLVADAAMMHRAFYDDTAAGHDGRIVEIGLKRRMIVTPDRFRR